MPHDFVETSSHPIETEPSTTSLASPPLHHDLHNVVSNSPSSALPRRFRPGGDIRSFAEEELSRIANKIRMLSPVDSGTSSSMIPGQRIIEYELAHASPPPIEHPAARPFQVVSSSEDKRSRICLTNFPNEILTHILSHMHPDTQAALSLVSKRFYALVTSPYAWRLAFTRFFPEQFVTNPTLRDRPNLLSWEAGDSIRADIRYFSRLTHRATWRTEYLLRTRLLRNLGRGKPDANSQSSSAPIRSGKGTSAVLTYGSKLPGIVTQLYALFTDGHKPSKVIHGASDVGVATLSDPTTGKISHGACNDGFMLARLEQVFPNLVPNGLGEGPMAVPNVMDISPRFGAICGEGFPGGRAYFRSVSEQYGKYLGHRLSSYEYVLPEIPRIPELLEGISCVWIAKDSGMLTATGSAIGMLTGSTLGVVTGYSVKGESSGFVYSNGDMKIQWVLCPGVPIIAIQVDDRYNLRRRADGRVWAVVLNALGEVYYLKDVPIVTGRPVQPPDVVNAAWEAGKTAPWSLLPDTQRQSLQSAIALSSGSMGNGESDTVSGIRKMEEDFHTEPARWREKYTGWSVNRKLEVDFANEDDTGAGESIFIVDCGQEGDEECFPRVRRYTRLSQSFLVDENVSESVNKPTHGHRDVWMKCFLDFPSRIHPFRITVTAMDNSLYAISRASEDALSIPLSATSPAMSPSSASPDSSKPGVPGHRARFVAVGTSSGIVIVWNARDLSSSVCPVRTICTTSPGISVLGLSSLYVVHGGKDGLVQAWDVLGSTMGAVRTLNAHVTVRIPEHVLVVNPFVDADNFAAVNAIYLDPDPTMLRGVMAFGTSIRYWAFNSTKQTRRKRRFRPTNLHGRAPAHRRENPMMELIISEAEELQKQEALEKRERARLQARFGVGSLGDLTEEEAMLYAQMLSEESFQLDKMRRAPEPFLGAPVDRGTDVVSSPEDGYLGTLVDLTSPSENSRISEPEPEPEPEPGTLETDNAQDVVIDGADTDFELQLQRALRLSLLESDAGDSSANYEDVGLNPLSDFDVPIQFKTRGPRKGKRSRTASSTSPAPSRASPASQWAEFGSIAETVAGSSRPSALSPPSSRAYAVPWAQEDEGLALALKLSMED